MINDRSPSKRNPDYSLYVHVPFCEKRCHYCDFTTWEAPQPTQQKWLETILDEIRQRGSEVNGKVGSIFFGGGTPSVLPVQWFQKLSDELLKNFEIPPGVEWTVECNPSSLDQEKLDIYHEIGVNRLSIGVQSFHDSELKLLGRIHDSAKARSVLQRIAKDGRFSFSGDLIFGLPSQTPDSFLESLEEMLRLGPDHISFYGLTIEPGTRFHHLHKQGKLGEMDEDNYVEMYNQGVSLLRDSGLFRYEVSNFSRPSKECKHNINYWNHVPYLGLGPGAHSLWKGKRLSVPKNLEGYFRWAKNCFDWSLSDGEIWSSQIRANETIYLQLRQARGLDLNLLKEQEQSLPRHYLQKWQERGMLHCIDSVIFLTDKGWLFLDEVVSDLISGLESVKP